MKSKGKLRFLAKKGGKPTEKSPKVRKSSEGEKKNREAALTASRKGDGNQSSHRAAVMIAME